MIYSMLLAAVLCFTATAQPNPLFSDRVTLDHTVAPPQILQIREREFEAIVEFTPNYDEPNGLDQFDDRVVSYLIEWGPVTQNFPFIIRQSRPNGQMQVLQDNVLFRGRIFNIALNHAGDNLVRSNFAEFFFRSSSAEINLLRQSSVFFDDFNTDEQPGDYDERRWNVAFDLCALERTANYNVNGQNHVHTQLGSLSDDCAAEILSARARAVFDFTGRTGQITVDVDGGDFPGHTFCVELADEKRDIAFFGQTSLPQGFRVCVDNSQLFIEQVLGNQQLIRVPGSEVNLFALGTNVYTIANIRRPWTYRISQNAISLFINEEVILDNLPFFLPLSFTRAHVFMAHEQRDSGINGNHAVTMHLDNIGFDGIAPLTQQLNYRNIQNKGFLPAGSVAAIPIPFGDDVSGVIRSTLFFTIMGTFDFNQVLQFNGRNFVIEPQGGVNPNAITDLVTVQVDVQGVGNFNNFASFPQGDFFVGNIHLELEYACDDGNVDRVFTAPESQCHFASNGFPISFNCDDELLARPTLFFEPSDVVFQEGPGRNEIQAHFQVDASTDRALRHNGNALGVQRFEVLIDCEIIEHFTVDVTGAAAQVVDLDFSLILGAGRGVKEVWIRAVDVDQRSSTFHPGRFDPTEEGLGRTLDYLPLVVDTNNRNVRLANVGEFDATCSPDPALELAFIGGNCDDECVFVDGIEGPTVCLDPNQAPIFIFRETRGERVPPRSELFSGDRDWAGFKGDWDENPDDVCASGAANDPTCVDPEAPVFHMENCTAFSESLDDGVDHCTFGEPSNWQPFIRFGGPQENHWLDRDVAPGFNTIQIEGLAEIVEAALAEEAVTAVDSSSGLAAGIVALIVILCLTAVGVGAFFFFRKSSSPALPVYEQAPQTTEGTYVPPLAA